MAIDRRTASNVGASLATFINGIRGMVAETKAERLAEEQKQKLTGFWGGMAKLSTTEGPGGKPLTPMQYSSAANALRAQYGLEAGDNFNNTLKQYQESWKVTAEQETKRLDTAISNAPVIHGAQATVEDVAGQFIPGGGGVPLAPTTEIAQAPAVVPLTDYEPTATGTPIEAIREAGETFGPTMERGLEATEAAETTLGTLEEQQERIAPASMVKQTERAEERAEREVLPLISKLYDEDRTDEAKEVAARFGITGTQLKSIGVDFEADEEEAKPKLKAGWMWTDDTMTAAKPIPGMEVEAKTGAPKIVGGQMLIDDPTAPQGKRFVDVEGFKPGFEKKDLYQLESLMIQKAEVENFLGRGDITEATRGVTPLLLKRDGSGVFMRGGRPTRLKPVQDVVGKRGGARELTQVGEIYDDTARMRELLERPSVKKELGEKSPALLAKFGNDVEKWLSEGGFNKNDNGVGELIWRLQKRSSDVRKELLGSAVTPTELKTTMSWMPDVGKGFEQLQMEMNLLEQEAFEYVYRLYDTTLQRGGNAYPYYEDYDLDWREMHKRMEEDSGDPTNPYWSVKTPRKYRIQNLDAATGATPDTDPDKFETPQPLR